MLTKRSGVYFSASFFFHSVLRFPTAKLLWSMTRAGAPAVKMTGALCIPAYNALWFVSRPIVNPLVALQQNAAAHQVKQTRPIRHREADYCGFTLLTAKRSTMFGSPISSSASIVPVWNLKTTHRNLDDQSSD
jgi:hypothetical protein